MQRTVKKITLNSFRRRFMKKYIRNFNDQSISSEPLTKRPRNSNTTDGSTTSIETISIHDSTKSDVSLKNTTQCTPEDSSPPGTDPVPDACKGKEHNEVCVRQMKNKGNENPEVLLNDSRTSETQADDCVSVSSNPSVTIIGVYRKPRTTYRKRRLHSSETKLTDEFMFNYNSGNRAFNGTVLSEFEDDESFKSIEPSSYIQKHLIRCQVMPETIVAMQSALGYMEDSFDDSDLSSDSDCECAMSDKSLEYKRFIQCRKMNRPLLMRLAKSSPATFYYY